MLHWVEHVILTKGAPHLRSPALNIPLYQKLYLDFLSLVLAGLIVLYKILFRIKNILMSCNKIDGKKKKK